MGIIIRQSIKGTLVNYVGAFIGFLTTMFIVTRFHNQEDFGLTRILAEAAMLLCAVGQFGTSFSTIKYFPYFKNNANKHNGFFFYVVILPLVGFILVSIVALVFQVPIKNYFSENAVQFVRYFYWIFPLAFFMIYQSVFETYSSILQRIVVPKFVREVLVRILIAIIYLLYLFNYIDLDWLVVSYVLVFGIAALVNLLYVAHIEDISLRPNFRIRKPVRKSVIFFTLYMIVASIGSSIVLKVDIFMVSGMMGLASTAIYTVAYFMAAIIEMPARSLSGVSTPIAAELFKKKEINQINTLYKKIALNQLVAGSCLFLLIWINIDNIFAIIPNGADYTGGKWVVFFIGLSKLIDSTCNFGNSLLSISKHYYYTLFFTFFLVALTIAGNYYLIPLFGVSGAAIAAMVAFIIYNGCMLLLIKKKINVQPFSMGILKVVVILLVGIVLNMFIPFICSPYIDGILRSILFGGLFLCAILYLKISPEILNTLLLLKNKVIKTNRK